MDWINEKGQELARDIMSLREAFHRFPEVGNHEYETAARIEEVLRELEIPSQRFGTAVVGTITGGHSGGMAALRADMDALPVQEETRASFASQIPGVMHACGHDVHMAGLLGAAMILCSQREKIPGRIRLIFQPDEEGSGGAQRLIRQDVLKDVDAVFGLHVSPDLPAGHAGFRSGKFYAASDMFSVRILGKSAHGAQREKGIDALGAAAQLVTNLLKLPSELTSDPCVLTVGTLHAGSAGNILSAQAEMEGIIRTLGSDTRARMKKQFYQTVETITHQTGTRAEISFRESYPGIVNDDGMTALACRTAGSILGASRVEQIDAPTMTTEDFGYYLLEAPGSFYHIGAGCVQPLHSPTFLPADDAPVTAAVLQAAIALAALHHRNDGKGE